MYIKILLRIFAPVNEIEDDGPLSFLLGIMNKEQIINAVETAVKERGCFLVEVTVSKENDIEIVIEKEEGVVDWEDCAAIDRVMHEAFNQDEEDYALTVSSAGLDRPFKVMKQFQKALGTKVDVWLKGGKKVKGVLDAATEESIVVDGATLPMESINSVRPLIDF